MPSFLRQRIGALLPWLMWFGLLLGAAPAQAQISCTATMSPLSFGSIDPLSSTSTSVSATLNYSCTNADWFTNHSARLCFSITEPNGQVSPRQMTSGTNLLPFQLWQNANSSTPWGSQFVSPATPWQTTVTVGPSYIIFPQTVIGSTTLYGVIPGNQTTVVPGSYQDNYGATTRITVNDTTGNTAPASCGTVTTGSGFPFTATATVIKNCTVAAGTSPINLGTVPPTATNVSGNTSISVTCSNTTPYYVGLLPSNGSTTGAGVMSGTGGNTSKVPYQLYSDAGLSQPWGNTATSTSPGNGVKGTGNGAAQSTTVYAKVPSADFQPDQYTDTVTVNVNY